jgi:L-ascorbate metabolism protein UlaG (beta-lactamase superfamily)
MFMRCTAFGNNPGDLEKKKFSQSKNFDLQRDQFINRKPEVIKNMQKRVNSWEMMWRFLTENNNRVPDHKLPEVKPDFEEFLKPSKEIKFIWFGHSNFIVNISGTIILFDPVFHNASPLPVGGGRFQDPVVPLEQLPEVDYIIISHDHYDHLEYKTALFFKNKKTVYITPLGVISHLKYWGIPENRLIEMDWWEEKQIGDLKIACTPAQHFSGRTGMGTNITLWASWVVKSPKSSMYFSGDSGYDIHFKQIGDKYGPFDLTFIENGQYNPLWREVHVLPEETAQAFLDLRGKKLVPVHWGMYTLSLHSWYEPVEEMEKLAKLKNIDYVTPKIGQLIDLGKENIIERWWKQFIQRFE